MKTVDDLQDHPQSGLQNEVNKTKKLGEYLKQVGDSFEKKLNKMLNADKQVKNQYRRKDD